MCIKQSCLFSGGGGGGGGGGGIGGCECVFHTNDGRTQGTFYSPKFPLVYPADLDCIVYTFVGDVTQIVEITFLEFDLPLPVDNR